MDDLSVSPYGHSYSGIGVERTHQRSWGGHAVAYPVPSCALRNGVWSFHGSNIRWETKGDLSEYEILKAGPRTFLEGSVTLFDDVELEKMFGGSPIWGLVEQVQAYLKNHTNQATTFYERYIKSPGLTTHPCWEMISSKMKEALEAERRAFEELNQPRSSQTYILPSSCSVLSGPHQLLEIALLRHHELILQLQMNLGSTWRMPLFWKPLFESFQAISDRQELHWIHEFEEAKAVQGTIMLFELLRRVLSHGLIGLIMIKQVSELRWHSLWGELHG